MECAMTFLHLLIYYYKYNCVNERLKPNSFYILEILVSCVFITKKKTFGKNFHLNNFNIFLARLWILLLLIFQAQNNKAQNLQLRFALEPPDTHTHYRLILIRLN